MSRRAGAAAPVAIDPGLKPEALRPAFALHGRLHIPGFLQPPCARAVHAALEGETPWRRSIGLTGRDLDLSMEDLEAMPPEVKAALDRSLTEGARQGFQYAFDSWRISDQVEAGVRSGHPGEALYDFLNGEAFLGFVRRLTGEPGAVYCDAQATRYRPGDFLTEHDDGVEGKNRLFAYVLNFTPAWRTDWGGLLLFHDADGHVSEGYAPVFNALNIFRVPQKHAVTYVAPFAGAARLSVTGWIRSRRP